MQLNVQEQTIIAVQLNLSGTGSQTEQLVATAMQAGGSNSYQQLLVGLSNTGSVMLKPYGNLQVIDARGKILQNLPMTLDTFLPETSIAYPVNVQKQALGAGTYSAVLTLTYGHNHVLHYTTNFTITQQQIKQTFGSGSLQAPPLANSSLPLWVIILIGVLTMLVIIGASGLVFWRLGRRAATERLKR